MDRRLDVLNSGIWNCENAFEFRCPKRWENLAPTADPTVRHCDVCRQEVHLSRTPEEFVANGERGRCVAVPTPMMPNNVAVMVLGQVSPLHLKRLAMRRDRCKTWWTRFLALKPAFSPKAVETIREAVARWARLDQAGPR